jgi:hypothetical protein
MLTRLERLFPRYSGCLSIERAAAISYIFLLCHRARVVTGAGRAMEINYATEAARIRASFTQL